MLLTSLPREEGQSMTEYALLLGLVTLVCITAFAEFGLATFRLFEPAVRAIVP